MVDWLAPMNQTYEYYMVDPGTWKDMKRLTNVKSSSISRDGEADTLGSASFAITETVGECYIRIYLVTIQNGVRERHALGTFLIQTPSTTFNGKVRDVTVDAYTSLLELKESLMPIGYFIRKGQPILRNAYMYVRDNVRAPVMEPVNDTNKNLLDDFVAEIDETSLGFSMVLLNKANYKFALDAFGRISFTQIRDISTVQPVWTYNDDNSSILYPEITMDHDLYDIPNVVEVVYNNVKAVVINDDPNSPTSTVNRGRPIMHRVTNPGLPGYMLDSPSGLRHQLEDYATNLLKELSTVEYTISYTHGYCPVNLGDCVRLNYERAGIVDIKARVISQNIKCEPGCPVSEKAIFTTKLWG